MTHQFSLFGFQKPVMKIPISKARIMQAKAELEKGRGGDQRTILESLRYLNDVLESSEKRITYGSK